MEDNNTVFFLGGGWGGDCRMSTENVDKNRHFFLSSQLCTAFAENKPHRTPDRTSSRGQTLFCTCLNQANKVGCWRWVEHWPLGSSEGNLVRLSVRGTQGVCRARLLDGVLSRQQREVAAPCSGP